MLNQDNCISCGDQTFNAMTHSCCINPEGGDYVVVSGNNNCDCGEYDLSSTTKSYICCGLEFPYDEYFYGDPQCCGNDVYDADDQGCCNGVVYDLNTEACCNNLIIDAYRFTCCSGYPEDNFVLGYGGSCCGSSGFEIGYNSSEQYCCEDLSGPGTVVWKNEMDLTDHMCCGNEFQDMPTSGTYKCCSSSSFGSVVPTSYTCCSGYGVDGTTEGCCGGDIYSINDEVCCSGNIYDYEECNQCCSGGSYTPNCGIDKCPESIQFSFFCPQTQCTNLKSVEVQLYIDHKCS